jgi:hypothetical protein
VSNLYFKTFYCQTTVKAFDYKFWTGFYPTDGCFFPTDVLDFFNKSAFEFKATENEDDAVAKIAEQIERVIEKIGQIYPH